MSFIFVCHFYIGTILGKMTLQRLFYLFATVSDWKHSLRFFASASRKTTATTTKIFHWFDPFALFLSFVLPPIVHSYFIAFVHDSFYRCIWPVRLSLAHTVIFNLGRCNRNDAPGEREREKNGFFSVENVYNGKHFVQWNILRCISIQMGNYTPQIRKQHSLWMKANSNNHVNSCEEQQRAEKQKKNILQYWNEKSKWKIQAQHIK